MMRAFKTSGFTLIEFLVSMVLGALIVAVMASVVSELSATQTAIQERGELAQDAHFAMTRMVSTVRRTRNLILPQQDKPATDWRENVREETIPLSPPEGSSTKATAVLAVSLGARIDLDADGIPDADNDGDGAIDEDYPADILFDDSPGIYQIDDGGNGSADEGASNKDDDDEQLNSNDEDPINGIDDEGDGLVDDDPSADMNGDGAPGIIGVDDDDDGFIDEGSSADDDEDGRSNEDWMDAVVFFLREDSLVERHPVPWDADGSGGASGRDYIESAIADGVSRFRVERSSDNGGTEIVDITLEITAAASGETVSLHTRVRVGGSP
jgi:prepilin-type N-terminal cleavage/methylation domain-containing protein